MIVLDTHIWVWWVHGDERLTPTQLEFIQDNEAGEIAKLVENGKLELPISLEK